MAARVPAEEEFDLPLGEIDLRWMRPMAAGFLRELRPPTPARAGIFRPAVDGLRA